MNRVEKANSEPRKAYLRRIVQNNSLDDIYSDERETLWNALSRDDQKKVMESKVYWGFVKESGIPADPFMHENEDPPLPDISTTIQGDSYYFELGEITDEALARAAADAEKTGENIGTSFSELDPLLRMFREKCLKKYQTDGKPVDLVLFYSKQTPYDPLGQIKAHSVEISTLIAGSHFARVWLYSDCHPRKILWKATR